VSIEEMISKIRAAKELIKNVSSVAAEDGNDAISFVDINSVVVARKSLEDIKVKIKLLRVCKKYDLLPIEIEKAVGCGSLRTGWNKSLNGVLKNIFFEQRRLALIEHDSAAVSVFGAKFWKHWRYIKLISGIRTWAVQKWRACLHNVNSRRERSCGTEVRGSEVLVIGTPNVDKKSKATLSEGPKFAPKYTPKPEELIADVKAIKDQVADEDKEGFNCMGSKFITQFGNASKCVSSEEANIKRTINKLREKGDRVLQADKESRLVVIDKEEFEKRSLAAIEKNFKRISGRINNLVGDRERVIEIFGEMENADNQGSWKSRVALSTLEKYLKVFFTVKTHKTEPFPFRTIVDSGGTWQNVLETFLLKGLNMFESIDTFNVKNTNEAVVVLDQLHETADMHAVSFDATDMYFNMSHEIILDIVEEQIIKVGVQVFNNKMGMDMFHFLELLDICLKTSIIKFDVNEELYIQKSGICIGSRIAPKIADLFTQRINSEVEKDFQDEIQKGLLRILKYVDDYLVIFHQSIDLQKIEKSFDNHKLSLEFTTELPNALNHLQFLDLLIIIKRKGICWRNQQRKAKGILPFKSNHSRAVKVGIVKGLMRTAVLNSCLHECQTSLNMQRKRLSSAGYKLQFVIQQIRALTISIDREKEPFENDKATVVIQYYHDWAHRIKKLAGQFNVRVIFKYGNKLGRLAPITNSKAKDSCEKSGHMNATDCAIGVVYQIPLSCGKSYVGQSGACINSRLYQHNQSLKPKFNGYSNLASHKKKCNGCKVKLKNTKVIERSGKKKVREILESFHIERGGDQVISECSMKLRQDELRILAANRRDVA
jgi:hypothetical protein